MPVPRSSQFYKTKICPWYFKGKCERKTTCRFAHGEYEKRILPDLSYTSLCPLIVKNKVCEDRNCKFAHSLEELRATDNYYKTSLCYMFVKNKCLAGIHCRHAHGMHELHTNLATAYQNTATKTCNDTEKKNSNKLPNSSRRAVDPNYPPKTPENKRERRKKAVENQYACGYQANPMDLKQALQEHTYHNNLNVQYMERNPIELNASSADRNMSLSYENLFLNGMSNHIGALYPQAFGNTCIPSSSQYEMYPEFTAEGSFDYNKKDNYAICSDSNDIYNAKDESLMSISNATTDIAEKALYLTPDTTVTLPSYEKPIVDTKILKDFIGDSLTHDLRSQPIHASLRNSLDLNSLIQDMSNDYKSNGSDHFMNGNTDANTERILSSLDMNLFQDPNQEQLDIDTDTNTDIEYFIEKDQSLSHLLHDHPQIHTIGKNSPLHFSAENRAYKHVEDREYKHIEEKLKLVCQLLNEPQGKTFKPPGLFFDDMYSGVYSSMLGTSESAFEAHVPRHIRYTSGIPDNNQQSNHYSPLCNEEYQNDKSVLTDQDFLRLISETRASTTRTGTPVNSQLNYSNEVHFFPEKQIDFHNYSLPFNFNAYQPKVSDISLLDAFTEHAQGSSKDSSKSETSIYFQTTNDI